MRLFRLALALILCFSLRPQGASTTVPNTQGPSRLSADTPTTTVVGNGFIAPKEWSVRVKGFATVLESPEGGSWIALVDVDAKTPDEALAAAWNAYKPEPNGP
jgi:hypothetical protein